MSPFRRTRELETKPKTGATIDREGRQRALVGRAARGDEAAFGDLYEELSGLVHGVVLKVLRDPSQAEEVTQEVFVELWRLATRFDDTRGSVKSWVCTIAHRRAVDRVRSEQSSRNRIEAEGAKIVRPHDEVSEIVELRFESERVAVALSTLTPTQRESIELAYYGGHTYRDVAVLLGVPEGTIKTRIRDGMIRLRDEMGVTT